MRNFKANYKDMFQVKVNTNVVKNSSNNYVFIKYFVNIFMSTSTKFTWEAI